jgi:hypothetical protein
MNSQSCFVTVQINDRIVKGPIGEEQAMAIAKLIADGIFPHDTPVPAYSDGNQSNHKQHGTKEKREGTDALKNYGYGRGTQRLCRSRIAVQTCLYKQS